MLLLLKHRRQMLHQLPKFDNRQHRQHLLRLKVQAHRYHHRRRLQ
jgi:hypothetical protein